MTALSAPDPFERWYTRLQTPVGRTRLLRADLLIVALVAIGSLRSATDPASGLISGVVPGTLVALVVSAGFLFRRRAPLLVSAFAAGGLIVEGSRIPVFLALYCLARHQRGHRTVVIGLAWAAFTCLKALLPGHAGASFPDQLLLSGLYAAFPVVFGLGSRAYERSLAALREERERRTERTRTEERLRLAREMHDVLGHRISIMAMQAGAIEAAGGSRPESRQLVRAVGDTARAAMRDLRQVLGALRDGEGSVVAGRRLGDLDHLVEEARSAGLPVTYHSTDPAAGPPPPEVALTVYRTVQEALTNTAKHAPGAHTTVRVRGEGPSLSVSVTNAPPPAGTPVRPGENGGGFGMTGLRERVSLLSGTFTAGPTPQGGWTVDVTLPLEGAPCPEPPSAAQTLTVEGCAP
ncbi:histidine kinase [Streptomyces sp. ZAF1911]|uniref:sensor histidine kinase n=1 Tax=Streptomyces sp. ZAF1911 TaxID=2944129 RepID=UPI00237C33AB|nr:histidine kinase [Streptomyces sp. ZAF1911]MDD9375644.1 histidine kinase [Streptomyces sp. ZAF1911]